MKYLPTIGIETHVQLNTKTKLFSAVGNDASLAKPNTLISHIDVGMPGALPVLNEKAIELCAKAALALKTKPQKFSKFERKHYFYPDLPKGYQITQLEDSIIMGGYLEIPVDSGTKKIEIERANLEEDAGKNTHPAAADYSLVDLNRAGTPLLEIVSKPQINSPAEAKAYAREMWLTMKYAGVTDGDLYLGHVRFDVNISVSAEPGKLGTRSEIKNLNSFRSVENAVAYEIKRQTKLLERGEKVTQETRGWDEAKQKSIGQRGKEEAHDYRYMPEPDIPPVELDDSFVNNLRGGMPFLPPDVRTVLSKLDISKDVVEDILDRPDGQVHRILEAVNKTKPELARRIAFSLLELPETVEIDLVDQIKVAEMVEANQLSSTAAKNVLQQMLEGKSLKDASESLLQVSDESEIETIVKQVIKDNPKVVADIKAGQEKAIGFLVGQVMAKSQGKANPQLAQNIIRKHL